MIGMFSPGAMMLANFGGKEFKYAYMEAEYRLKVGGEATLGFPFCFRKSWKILNHRAERILKFMLSGVRLTQSA
jgi:hypothetical protein